MMLSVTDAIALTGVLTNVGLLTGIFFKLGLLGQSLVDLMRRIETLEKRL